MAGSTNDQPGIGDDSGGRISNKKSEIRTAAVRQGLIYGSIILGLGFLFLQSISIIGFSVEELVRYLPAFRDALGQYFPLTNVFGLPVVDVGQYWQFIIERSLFDLAVITLAIGFAGTAIGLPGALIFGIFGSERIIPFPFNFLFRGTMSIIRAIPALVWMLIYIPLGGVSPFTATLAVATETIGNMGRLFTDELEEIDEGTIEGIRSTGAQSTQIVYFGMLSQVIRPFLAWTLYLVEGSIRMAVGLGLLGAGGLGYVLEMERGMFNYTNMMATILTIMILVMSVEIISQRTRSYLRGGDTDDSMGFLERLRTLPRRIVASIL